MDTRLCSVLNTRFEGRVRVNNLYSLLKLKPRILDNFEPFVNNPLHIAAANNNIEIVMELMILKPSLGNLLNFDGDSPLHIAVEKGHTKVALELIKSDPTLVRVRGRGGVTPLHLVAEKGGVDHLTMFIRACPESIQDVNLKGETALHILVKTDKIDELKVVTGWMQRMRSADAVTSVLNRCDHEGNTALHLAASQNNDTAVLHLLRCKSMNLNIRNNVGKTALDLLLDHGEDQMNETAKQIMERAGVKTSASLPQVASASLFLRKPVSFGEYCKMKTEQFRSRLSDGTRNSLLVISALIIQSAYQYSLQPPASVKDDVTAAKYCTIVLLSVLNSMCFYVAVVFTYLLLPEGMSYKIWYYACISPLCYSFYLSIYTNSVGLSSEVAIAYGLVFICSHTAVIFLCAVFLFGFYKMWKQNKLQKVSNEPRSELNVQGFKSTDYGIAE